MKRKLSVAVLAVVLSAVAWWGYREFGSATVILERERALRELIASRPVPATVVGFVIYTLLCYVPGAGGKSLIVGWLFGFWSGLVQVNLGLTLVALTTFWLSRHFLFDLVHRKWGRTVGYLDRALTRDGVSYLFALRVLHAPYTLTNYALGATSIRTRDFWWATQLGMLPGNVAFVYAGSRFPSLERLLHEGPSAVLTGPAWLAFGLVGLLPLALRLGLRRLRPGLEARLR